MRPEPSTILRYLLQVGGSQALSSLEAHDIPPAARELGADVSVAQYLHFDLQETYLRYANSAVNNDMGYEDKIKRSTVSKQVNELQHRVAYYIVFTKIIYFNHEFHSMGKICP